MSLDIAVVLLDHCLEVRECLLKLAVMEACESSLHIALQVDLPEVRLGLLRVYKADSMGIGVNCFTIALQSFETVADTKLPREGLLASQLYELLEIRECLCKLFLQEQVLASRQVRIRIVWVDLNASL